MEISANDQQMLQDDLVRAEQDLRRRALWGAMEDEPTASRLIEIAIEHTRLMEAIHALRSIGLERNPSNIQLKLSVDTLQARISQLAKERENLTESFYEYCV
ncbi:hypothetical protein ABE504_25190 [Paenibacillus oryzisoli]|uniref:hypothetical protein n=1 Tax=Paenibacillus oryzisoli TaxID=1850517 RepID=UPI003D2C5F09